MCCLIGIAALLPALRAGRFSAAQAIAAGRAPRTGRGYAAHRLLGRLALPRPVTIGLAAPFARPARTAITLTAVLLGATAVTFAVGLGASLNRVVNGVDHASTEPVQVFLPTGGPGGSVSSRARASGGRPGPATAVPSGPGKPITAGRGGAGHHGGTAGAAGHPARTSPRPTSWSAWPGCRSRSR